MRVEASLIHLHVLIKFQSASSEISQLNLEQYFNENTSPDLFSQDDAELLEVKVDIDTNFPVEETKQTCKKSDSKQTSSLFFEIQKLDCENAELVSSSSLSQKRLTPNNESMDNSIASSPSEQKKNKNRKITDYFSKM